MLVSMMGKSANQLPPPKKLKMIKAAEDLEVGEEEGDDDDELSADDEPPPELPGELGEAAKEASRAAEEASSIPDQPPAFDPRSAIDMAIAAELEDGASDQEDDDDEDEGEDEDDIEPEDEEPDVDLDETEEHGESPKDEAPKAGGMPSPANCKAPFGRARETRSRFVRGTPKCRAPCWLYRKRPVPPLEHRDSDTGAIAVRAGRCIQHHATPPRAGARTAARLSPTPQAL
eukprot:1198763-Pleurochrysis_carterae.AAC.4